MFKFRLKLHQQFLYYLLTVSESCCIAGCTLFDKYENNDQLTEQDQLTRALKSGVLIKRNETRYSFQSSLR